MKEILAKIEQLQLLTPHSTYISSHNHIKQFGWSDLKLHEYQLSGVNWLLSQYYNKHGCILGDEMGLGKTCQTIACILFLRKTEKIQKPDIVICPRSVLENWQLEFERFSPNLKVKCLIGEKNTRQEILEKMVSTATDADASLDVLLTTYEICLRDELLKRISWHLMVVDEGHRLKSQDSMLRSTLVSWNVHQRILLTGTPVQNNLQELFSLLNFVSELIFPMKLKDYFVEKYQTQTDKKATSELHQILKPFLLRRVKESVLDLPNKSEVVLFHGLSALQKKLYKAILTKDHTAFLSSSCAPGDRSQHNMMNIFIQLRKCVNHPYLFDGIEEEPFEIGEHLVNSSGKLELIDQLLQHLKNAGHKVLMFSQMTRMLDILQDFLTYRGYTYERLDGSTRGDERFLAVQNFNRDEGTFIFLLSTRAGGQGLNLTAADTVIFVDSDLNPQMDLQAVARSHRFGQSRPVKIIRLIGADTVEDIIFQRSAVKLKLTKRVIEEGNFSLKTQKASQISSITDDKVKLQDILKFGVDKLLQNPSGDTPLSIDFPAVLGSSDNNQWTISDQEEATDLVGQQCFKTNDDAEDQPSTIYQFDGFDYSKAPSAADLDAFDTLGEEAPEVVVGKRRNVSVAMPSTSSTKLTPEQIEERENKRKETLEQKLKEREALARKRAAEKEEKKAALWKENGYVSCKLTSDGSEEDSDEEENSVDPVDISYVRGDVTHPVSVPQTDQSFVIHCIDNSGQWGVGGVFTAITTRSTIPKTQYELAKEMKDINLGDCHLITLNEDEKCWLALIVAQHRTKSNNLSGIKMEALQEGLRKVSVEARQRNASVHLPRIGHDTPSFNWYGTERLIRKHLAVKGIPTYIYYYPRRGHLKRRRSSQEAGPSTRDDEPSSVASPGTALPGPASPVCSTSQGDTKKQNGLLETFQGLSLHLWNCNPEDSKMYKRYIIAYDGEFHSEITESTTHVVVCINSDIEDLASTMRYASSAAFVVSVKWLRKCLKTGQCCPVEPFEVDIQ
ncbi:chromodomain-helicase-DNA-binding protein 1-like isoform X1 [Octopus bimaculoides]|uniref:Chromodomain-helicase-DNA-binding protein 1-like n=2 Tax=Octopus bimaculoides TaxID=37653 RepID=A0A0L8GXZ6_OCTBM|nr:chromodomain-helicase-DNA-binding protein 1-like isoform X1 [Octopus bimaculoides]|eukprot:XP_014777205.1 PREDICTED: chromodomain-helicase-DNA-binding protein 1-like isoform X1 [Octopus bimaculoides]